MTDDRSKRSGSWDPLVRLTHWGIAAAVLANAAFTEEGGAWHVWIGTAMAGMLGLRLIWGVIGPREARFSAFPPSPSLAIAHIRDIRAGRREAHRSHNGLGALMAYAIWGTLSVVAVTGFSMSGFPPATPSATLGTASPQAGIVAEGAEAAPRRTVGGEDGDEVGDDEDEGRMADHRAGRPPSEAGEWVEELHEGAVTLLYGLIILHLLGVLMETVRTGFGVVGRMIGRSG